MRIFWHPYTDDSEDARVDVTEMHPSRICAALAKAMPTYENVARIKSAMHYCRPLFDPKLGCLLYVE